MTNTCMFACFAAHLLTYACVQHNEAKALTKKKNTE